MQGSYIYQGSVENSGKLNNIFPDLITSQQTT